MQFNRQNIIKISFSKYEKGKRNQPKIYDFTEKFYNTTKNVKEIMKKKIVIKFDTQEKTAQLNRFRQLLMLKKKKF